MIEELLSESELTLSQLDAIACHVGPGAFTGVRIAVSAAQGLAYGADLPTLSLSTLTNLALSGFAKTGQKNWLCAIDARMQEVYFSAVSVNASDQVSLLSHQEQEPEESVIAPDQLDFDSLFSDQLDLNIGLIGSGWLAYEAIFFEQKSSNSAKIGKQCLNKTQLFEQAYPQAIYSLEYAESLFKQNQWLEPAKLQPSYVRTPVFKRSKKQD